MSILTWNNQFNLGIPSIDEQHRRLIDIINQLDEAVAIGDEPQSVIDLIKALIDYTHYHFTHEERLMTQACYDNQHYAKHKKQHEQFVTQMLKEQEKAKIDPDSVSNALLEFLMAWLSEHILVSDKQMAQEIRQQIISTEESLRKEQTDIMQSNLYSALRESENRFKQLADHLPALIWLTNSKQQLVFCNTFWLKTFALTRTELSKPNWFKAIDERDRYHVQDIHAKVTSERSAQQLEYRIIHRENQPPLWILETVAPRERKNGQLAGLMGCGMDITAQKLAESHLEQQVNQRTQELQIANKRLEFEKKQQIVLNHRLQEMQNHLIQSEKMASIGQLAAGVAHEINNPLGYISSNLNTLQHYMQELLETADLAAQLAQQVPIEHPAALAFKNLQQRGNLSFIKQDFPDLVSEALEGAIRAKTIVQNLRDFSQIEKHEARLLFDLEAGIDATLDRVSNQIYHKAQIVKEYMGIKPFACVGHQINLVIMNLLVNAAHAIADFGKITLRTGYKEADWIWFEVEDTGIGIPDEIKSKIFDPFFTNKPVGQGTGLGLYLTYKIIQDHQGSIELNSVAGQGSKFRVYLPKH